MNFSRMLIGFSVTAVAAVAVAGGSSNKESGTNAPAYTAEGNLKFPSQYREWIFVTSGAEINYGANTTVDHAACNNVFVNAEAHKAFVQTGTWPDKTILVFEVRKAGNNGSINKARHFQTEEIVVRQVHVKDEARFPGKWAFFTSEDGVTGKLLPREADCYSCHEQHGAVDTTFVQFYPTLLGIA